MTHPEHDVQDGVAAAPVGGVVEDPPVDLDDIQQREPIMPAVRVEVEGPVRVQNLPNRAGNGTVDAIAETGQPTHILYADTKRACALMIGSVNWVYMTNQTGTQLPWPANVPLPITHSGHVWAKSASGAGAGTISTISEFFAD